MAMGELAWSGVIDHAWVPRSGRPRDRGVTMVIDTGLGLAATADTIETSGPYIDHWKLGFGTSAAESSACAGLNIKSRILASAELIRFSCSAGSMNSILGPDFSLVRQAI